MFFTFIKANRNHVHPYRHSGGHLRLQSTGDLAQVYLCVYDDQFMIHLKSEKNVYRAKSEGRWLSWVTNRCGRRSISTTGGPFFLRLLLLHWDHLLCIFYVFPILNNLVPKLCFLVASWSSDDKPTYFVPVLSGLKGTGEHMKFVSNFASAKTFLG